jgi:hypothetical protein
MAHKTHYSRRSLLGTMQQLLTLPNPLKIVALAAAVLVVAVGMGVVAGLTLGADEGPPEGAKPERAGEANPKQSGETEDVAEKAASDGVARKPERAGEANPKQISETEDVAEKAASDGPSGAAYLDEVASIQNGSVDTSLRSNDKLLRYDGLTAEDVKELKDDYIVLENYARRARDLAPPAEREDQYKEFVLAISELRDANELAYRLAADPSSATQADFEAYDRHVDRATAHLRRSNEMLGKDYKTTAAAQKISLG